MGIKIFYKNNIIARLFQNILKKENLDYIRDEALRLDKYIKDVPVDSKKRTSKIYDDMLNNMFNLIENTNFKKAIINWHNKYFRNCSGGVQDFCRSKDFKIHNIESLDDIDERKRSLDIVTQDFLQTCRYGTDEEKMQKTAYWANRIAHGCETEIYTFSDEFLGRFYSEYEVYDKYRDFLNKIREANKKFTEEQWMFDETDLQNEISKEDFDINTTTNPNVLKALELAKEVKLKIDSTEKLRDFVHCNKLETAAKNFHSIKGAATVDLINYLKNPNIDEEDKTLVAVKVPDEKMKNQEGEALTRIVVFNKEIYEEYFKNNTSLFFSHAFLSQFVDKNSKHKETEINQLRQKLEKQYKDRMIDEETMKILMEIGAVSVYHIPNSELEKNNIELNEPCSPLVECAANYFSPVADISPSIEKDDYLREKLEEKGVKQNIVKTPEGKENVLYNKMHRELHGSAKSTYKEITGKVIDRDR